jgi:hypothetical protein
VSEPDAINIVVATLQAEFRRTRTKLNGAAKRRTYAVSQEAIEANLMAEHQADLDMLADAIISSGGDLPGNEDETP